jgi:hypothetical protein
MVSETTISTLIMEGPDKWLLKQRLQSELFFEMEKIHSLSIHDARRVLRKHIGCVQKL